MKLSIVGYGNLGHFYADRLTESGWSVNIIRARELTHPITASGPVLICVPENEITAIAHYILQPDIVLHTSGSIGPEILRPHHCVGVLHPIMTFHRSRSYPGIYPATFEGDTGARGLAEQITSATGGQLIPFKGNRAQYHAAAVIAGNLTTVLLNSALKLLCHNGYSEDEAKSLLKPLATASVDNVESTNLRDHLTGPIARSQVDVLESQRLSLNVYDRSLAKLYQEIVRYGINEFNDSNQ